MDFRGSVIRLIAGVPGSPQAVYTTKCCAIVYNSASTFAEILYASVSAILECPLLFPLFFPIQIGRTRLGDHTGSSILRSV